MEKTVKEKKPKGTVHIKKEMCKGCNFCIEFCPTDVLAFSQDFNAKGYHYPVVVNAEDCSGCDLCGLYCPDFAIHGIAIKDRQEGAR